MTHICLGKPPIIGSDNDLSPGRRQAIIWTSAGIVLIRPLGTNFSQILIGIQPFSFQKMYLKMLPVKWRPFCLGLNVLTLYMGAMPKWANQISKSKKGITPLSCISHPLVWTQNYDIKYTCVNYCSYNYHRAQHLIWNGSWEFNVLITSPGTKIWRGRIIPKVLFVCKRFY